MEKEYIEDKLLTVVVPIYNKGKYLATCIESIIKQTYSKMQIILVNDGSTDDSIDICRKFEKLDKRIEVIDRKNKGVSCARNIGIKYAKGYYITFIDADDFINQNMFSFLIYGMKSLGTQWCECDWSYNENNLDFINSTFQVCIDGRVSVEKSVLKLFVEGHLSPVWNKVYKLDTIKNHKVYFDEEINLFEDCLFNIKYFKVAGSVGCIKEKMYGVRERNQGETLSTSHNSMSFEISKRIYYELLKLPELNKERGENFFLFNLAIFDMLFSSIIEVAVTVEGKQVRKKMRELLNEEIFNDIIANIKYFRKKISMKEKTKIFIVEFKMTFILDCIYKIKMM